MKAAYALLISGVAATWNRRASHFNSPQYNNNECSDDQRGGYDWSDLPEGSFSGYKDFNFGGGVGGGWSCSNKFNKRDGLVKRTFDDSKCIKNKVGTKTPATFDCGDKRKEGFSVKEIKISVEFDCNLKFHYKMPDQSICKHEVPCSAGGSVVQNTQCGGAQGVEVYLGEHKQPNRDDCEIGFHHIGFDCNPGYTPPAKTSTPPAETSTSPPVYSSPPESSAPESSAVETSTPPENTPPPVYQSLTSSVGIYTNSSAPIPPPPATSSEEVPVSSEAPSSSVPVYTPPGSTEVVESSSVPLYTAPSSIVESSSVFSAPEESSTTASPQSSSPPGPPGGYTPPECLPKCMNTWIEIQTGCKDNTDVNCYCQNPDFTKSVIECVKAWASDEETQQALTYLVGICASYVPQNPGIITNCPSTVPLGPTYTPPPAPSASESSVPVVPVPESSAEASSIAVPPASETIVTSAAPLTSAPPAPPAGPSIPCTTITYETTVGTSTISTTVTVPQVVFTTEPPAPPAPGAPAPSSSEEPVALVPGTPPPAVAITTGAVPPYPVPSSLGTVTLPAGTGASATQTGPAQFTGAASSVHVGYAPALAGAMLAFFAL
ncbi:hypothetical protein EJ04DRAFT_524739 [Polyplosphaeria fusca]|uniref:CFEM domain-containing protein n=1 Tax=Polyplosphaeria fusca TaxID=682080 RepID=A0A9P4QXP3_9PLEO|nr:hypothetical protein EJ04DRAFT_524739 [Polyplosphaeria fusca]